MTFSQGLYSHLTFSLGVYPIRQKSYHISAHCVPTLRVEYKERQYLRYDFSGILCFDFFLYGINGDWYETALTFLGQGSFFIVRDPGLACPKSLFDFFTYP